MLASRLAQWLGTLLGATGLVDQNAQAGNSPWWMTALVPRPAHCKARHVELGCARQSFNSLQTKFGSSRSTSSPQPAISPRSNICHGPITRHANSWMRSRPDPGIQVNTHTVSGAIVKLNSSSLRTVFRIVWLEGRNLMAPVECSWSRAILSTFLCGALETCNGRAEHSQ